MSQEYRQHARRNAFCTNILSRDASIRVCHEETLRQQTARECDALSFLMPFAVAM
jgi:hypothetical protein